MNANLNFHESEKPAGSFMHEPHFEPQFPPSRPLGMSKGAYRLLLLILWGMVLGPLVYYLVAGVNGRF